MWLKGSGKCSAKRIARAFRRFAEHFPDPFSQRLRRAEACAESAYYDAFLVPGGEGSRFGVLEGFG